MTNTRYSNGVAQPPDPYTYGYDTHGSASQLLDQGRNTAASYGYQPYGQPDPALSKGDTDTTTPFNPFRYTAKRYDTGSATYDMGARRFGPDTNRFLNQDLVHGSLDNLALSTDPLTANRYALAAGNPISYAEWDGHIAQPDGGGGTGTTSGGTSQCYEAFACNPSAASAYTPTPAGTTSGSATQRASARDQAPDVNRDQERWEKRTRTRLGDYLRAHPATEQQEGDGVARDWRADDKRFVWSCTPAPYDMGPPNCGYKYVGPTWDYPKYCVGVCGRGSIGIFGVGRGELEVSTIEGDWGQGATLVLYNPAGLKEVTIEDRLTGKSRSTNLLPGQYVAYSSNVFGYQPIHRKFRVSWAFPIVSPDDQAFIGVGDPFPVPLQWAVCSNNCGPPQLVNADAR